MFANPGGPPFLFLGLAYMSNTTTGFGGKDGAVGVFRNGSYSLQSLLPDGQVQTETGEATPGSSVQGRAGRGRAGGAEMMLAASLVPWRSGAALPQLLVKCLLAPEP